MFQTKLIHFYLPLVIFVSLCIHIHFWFIGVDDQRKALKTTGKIIIYAATKFFNTPIQDKNHLAGCSDDVKNQCTISSNPDDFSRSKAVVFHARDLSNFGFLHNVNLKLLMRNRKPNVPFIFWTMESPSNERVKDDYNDLINWKMSYKTNSDIFYPYSTILPLNRTKNVDLEKIWKTKTNGTVWLVSNCDTVNKRMELVQKMIKTGLKVDIFGKCGTEPPNCPRFNINSSNCEKDLMKPYKFLIAIENSNCVDYVTEKFWKALDHRMIVPIVLARKNYKNLGIPDSAYIAVDDFKNLDDFVKFVHHVGNNKDEYLKYHEWRRKYEIVDVLGVGKTGFGFCKLCKGLLENSGIRELQSKNVDVRKWHSESECNNSIASRFIGN